MLLRAQPEDAGANVLETLFCPSSSILLFFSFHAAYMFSPCHMNESITLIRKMWIRLFLLAVAAPIKA